MKDWRYYWRLYLGWCPVQFCMVCGHWYWGGFPRPGWMPWWMDYCSRACADEDIAFIEKTQPLPEPPGRWEVVHDDDGVMVRVRWSIPDEQGRYFWVRHYPATAWGMNACEGEAERMNKERRRPWEFREFNRQEA